MPVNDFVNSEGQIEHRKEWYVDRQTDIRQERWIVEATYNQDHQNKNAIVFMGPQAKEFSLIWENLLKVILP